MRSTEGPLHLLFLNEPSADHLVDRRLNECRPDPFALSPSLADILLRFQRIQTRNIRAVSRGVFILSLMLER